MLGANDGIVSTASLIVGVAAADAGSGAVMTAGVAGLVAGAMSMAAGEYVSVSSQKDTEQADLKREREELRTDPQAELDELAAIYVARGVDSQTAEKVAEQMTAHDALGAHARDELGITEVFVARPIQAAAASSAAFVCGGIIPVLVAGLLSPQATIPAVVLVSLLTLACLGGFAARLGGATVAVGIRRVTFWGALSMGLTMLVGHAFGSLF